MTNTQTYILSHAGRGEGEGGGGEERKRKRREGEAERGEKGERRGGERGRGTGRGTGRDCSRLFNCQRIYFKKCFLLKASSLRQSAPIPQCSPQSLEICEAQ